MRNKNGQQVSFTYDPHHDRFLKIGQNGDKTYYFGRDYEQIQESNSTKHKYYVYVEGRLILIREEKIHSNQQNPTGCYTHMATSYIP